MIWLCVFPTLTALNLTLGDWLGTMSTVVRTFVLATIAVPIVIYGLMPRRTGHGPGCDAQPALERHLTSPIAPSYGRSARARPQ